MEEVLLAWPLNCIHAIAAFAHSCTADANTEPGWMYSRRLPEQIPNA